MPQPFTITSSPEMQAKEAADERENLARTAAADAELISDDASPDWRDVEHAEEILAFKDANALCAVQDLDKQNDARGREIARLRAQLAAARCSCYPNPLDHEDDCPRGVPANVPQPYFQRGLTFHDGVVYNHHRAYTDRTGIRWQCSGREDETPLWNRGLHEMGWSIDVVVERHGPLTLVADAFFDASDEELVAMLAGREMGAP